MNEPELIKKIADMPADINGLVGEHTAQEIVQLIKDYKRVSENLLWTFECFDQKGADGSVTKYIRASVFAPTEEKAVKEVIKLIKRDNYNLQEILPT